MAWTLGSTRGRTRDGKLSPGRRQGSEAGASPSLLQPAAPTEAKLHHRADPKASLPQPRTTGGQALPRNLHTAAQPIWFEGSWGQTEILGSAEGKTIWQIKRAVLTAYRRQYQTTIAHYQAKLEGLKGIKLNGEY